MLSELTGGEIQCVLYHSAGSRLGSLYLVSSRLLSASVPFPVADKNWVLSPVSSSESLDLDVVLEIPGTPAITALTV